jgi:dienelactone hydrolase
MHYFLTVRTPRGEIKILEQPHHLWLVHGEPPNLSRVRRVLTVMAIRKFKILGGIGCMCFAMALQAQSWVRIDYNTGSDTPNRQVEGVLRSAEPNASGHALLILHHGGGFGFNTTRQYGEYFSRRGFVTLELKMFQEPSGALPAQVLLGQVAGALKFLSNLDGVTSVSAMGMSLGAFLTLNATTNWFYDHYALADLRFKKLVAVYPVCWFYAEAARQNIAGIRPFAGLPENFFQRSAGIPLLILAAGRDSYDGSNPEICTQLVKEIPDEKQRALTRLEVFTDATHGWDHGKTYSFPTGGCIGRTNCINQIISSPEVTERGKQSALNFLQK